MADSKITELTELTSIDDADVLAVVDDSAVPKTTKKISAQNLVKNDSDVSANTTHRSRTDNPHAVTQTQVGLGNVDNTSDVDKPVSTAQQTALDLKYDNTNPANYIDSAGAPVQPADIADFETTTELNSRDTANRDRANHTGTQLAATISDFASTALSTLLTGLSLVTSTAVTATDSILVAIGKLQAQINAIIPGSKVIRTDYFEGITLNPETTATNSATASVIPEMTDTFVPAAADDVVDVFFSGTFGESVVGKDATVHIGIFIDGTLIATTERSQNVKGTLDTDKIASFSTQWSGSLSVASHTIDVRFWVPAGVGNTIRAIGIRRNLIIKETDQ